MQGLGILARRMAHALVALSLAASTLAFSRGAFAAERAKPEARPDDKHAQAPRPLGAFTPSLIDAPGSLLRPGTALDARQFRFTPSGKRTDKHTVTIATHSRLAAPLEAGHADSLTGYDIGVAVGSRGLALSGAVRRTDAGVSQREAVSLGFGYGIRDWTTTLKVGEETNALRGSPIDSEKRYSVELGGAYSIAKDVKLGAGVRYRVVPGDSDAQAQARSAQDRAAFLGLGIAF